MKKIITCFAILAMGFMVLAPMNADANSVQYGYKSFLYARSGSSYTSTSDGSTAWVSTTVTYTWSGKTQTGTDSATGIYGYANAEVLVPSTWTGIYTKGKHQVGGWVAYSNAPL